MKWSKAKISKISCSAPSICPNSIIILRIASWIKWRIKFVFKSSNVSLQSNPQIFSNFWFFTDQVDSLTGVILQVEEMISDLRVVWDHSAHIGAWLRRTGTPARVSRLSQNIFPGSLQLFLKYEWLHASIFPQSKRGKGLGHNIWRMFLSNSCKWFQIILVSLIICNVVEHLQSWSCQCWILKLWPLINTI